MTEYKAMLAKKLLKHDGSLLIELDDRDGLPNFTIIKTTPYNLLEYQQAMVIHNEMLEKYRNKEWNYATSHCWDLESMFDGQLALYYKELINRINECRKGNQL